LDWPAHWLDRFLVHYRAAGLELDRAVLDEVFTAATAFAYRTSDRLYQFDLETTIRYLVGHQLASLRQTDDQLRAAIDAIGAERAATAISASFAAESRAGLAASRALFESLAGRFQLGVVSNFYGNLERILTEYGLMPLVAFVADSSRLGISKPDPRIFNAALEALDVNPPATLMVGDSLDKDCAPARALGMRTAWLRHRVLGSDADSSALANADFTIDGLAELQHLKWISG
ncbi:MAG TPA: HAD family hydrolase, partial [Candidatus Binataceae bacterium]|nr:HAD family hydrolase [Candidatus Binataceae bacterium]